MANPNEKSEAIKCCRCGRSHEDGVNGWYIAQGPPICTDCYVKLDPQRN